MTSLFDPFAPGVLLGLQAAQVAILWLHDWVPLPPINDVAAVRRENSLRSLVTATVIQSAPYTVGLVGSAMQWAAAPHGWVLWWLWVSYAILLVGELQAWWAPYLLKADPKRAERYRLMFGKTHGFLPERNGITPNTLHVVLHACTAATLVVLALLALTPRV